MRFVANRLKEVPPLSHAVLTRDLHFVSANKSYSRLFDFSEAQFQKMSLADLLHPGDIPRFRKIIRVLLNGGGTCEVVEWRVTGSGHYVLAKDTLWGIGSDRVRGPQYIATVSEKIADQDEAARLVECARSRNRGRSCRISGQPIRVACLLLVVDSVGISISLITGLDHVNLLIDACDEALSRVRRLLPGTARLGSGRTARQYRQR